MKAAKRLDLLEPQRILKAFFDIRPGEASRALLLAANLFLVIASFYILKPVRSSVFLVTFGPQQLPYVFILIAILGGAFAWVTSNLTRRLRIDHLLIATSAAMAAGLLLFRLLLHLDQGWVSYAFYVFVSLYGGVSTSQFWLLANNLFDAREARRLFGFVASGGILGSIAGSAVASTLADNLRVENLILVAALLVAISIPITARAWPLGVTLASSQSPPSPSGAARGASKRKGGMREMLATIRGSRHLTLLTGIIGLTVVASTMVDYLFCAEAYNHFAVLIAREQAALAAANRVELTPAQFDRIIHREVEAELTRFFGRFLGLVSVVALLLQIGLSGRILRRLGVTAANHFLPLGLLAGAGGICMVPGLFTASAARLVDGALSYSIHRSGSELLFFPLPLAVKNRTKPFIDLFADRLARGLAGVLILLLAGTMVLQTRGLAAILAVIVLLWLLLLGRMRGEYLTTFRRAIAGRTLAAEEIREMVQSPDAIRILADGLVGDERQILYSLTLLESADSDLLAPHLAPLLSHPSSEVRRLAMGRLAQSRDVEHRDRVAVLLGDPSREVRREAVRYLAGAAPDGAGPHLRSLLASTDWQVRGAALEVIADDARSGRDPERLGWIDGPLLDSFLTVEGPGQSTACAVVAHTLGALGPGSPHSSLLQSLLDHPDPTVRREAAAAAGELRDPIHLRRLVTALANPAERTHARAAIARYGPEILPALETILDDNTSDLRVRVQVPAAIGLMQSQSVVAPLLGRMRHPVLAIRYQVIKALGKMRARDRDRRLAFEVRAVETALIEETRDFFELNTTLVDCGGDGDRPPAGAEAGLPSPAPGALLIRALGERIDMSRERIFRILGLRYPTENMLFAYNGALSTHQARRAATIEFLDNLLSPRLKRWVLPAAAGRNLLSLAQRGRELFQLPVREHEEALRQISAGSDEWLAACAIDAAQATDTQTAESIANRSPRILDMLTILEKVKILLQIDILTESTSEELSYIATIAEEEEFPPQTVVFRAGDPPDAMFVLLSGRIKMVREGSVDLVLEVGPGEAIGAWALFDDQPRALTAMTTEASHLLRIDREQFFDVLSDHAGITQGVFKALVRRIRALAETAV